MRIIRDQDNSFRRIPGTCGYTVRVRHEKAFDSSSPYDAAIHGQDILGRITDPCLSKNAWNLSRACRPSKERSSASSSGCRHAAVGVRRRRLRSSKCWVWMRWMRVLMWGCWSWSIQRGGIHSGSRSVLMRQVQPFCAKWVWWYRQSRVRLSRSVRPPRVQSRMWCRSQ